MTSKTMKKDQEEVRRVNALVTPAWIKQIDEWRRHQPDIPTVSESIRRLVEIGIACSHQDSDKKRR